MIAETTTSTNIQFTYTQPVTACLQYLTACRLHTCRRRQASCTDRLTTRLAAGCPTQSSLLSACFGCFQLALERASFYARAVEPATTCPALPEPERLQCAPTASERDQRTLLSPPRCCALRLLLLPSLVPFLWTATRSGRRRRRVTINPTSPANTSLPFPGML
jgi:hypothetical protein